MLSSPFNRSCGLAVVNFTVFALLCTLLINNSSDNDELSRELRQGRKDCKEVSYDLAFNESYGFFDDIENAHWLLQKQKAMSRSIFKTPSNPHKGIENMPLWMLNNMDPIFTCPHVVRVGGMGEGGKWTCDPHRLTKRQDCLIYSVGSAGKYAFEDSLFKLTDKQCEIHVFDPNPKYARPGDIEEKNITYHPWGLQSSYVPSKPFNSKFEFRTFLDTLKELGHESRRIDIFKIDCEGCEWTTYKDWMPDHVDLRQILIEVHPSIAQKNNISMATVFADFLRAGFVPFSKEANTHPAAQPPLTLFELGFVRLSQNFVKAHT